MVLSTSFFAELSNANDVNVQLRNTRKRAFLISQTEEEKLEESKQAQSRMSALRGKQSEEGKLEESEKAQSRMSALRGKQSEEEKIEESEQAQSRMSAFRGKQSEEEKIEESKQAQSRMSALRGKHTMAERKEARTANSSKKRLARELFSPEQKESNADLVLSRKPFHGFERDINVARELFYAMGKTAIRSRRSF